jgi:hypothetical protein
MITSPSTDSYMRCPPVHLYLIDSRPQKERLTTKIALSIIFADSEIDDVIDMFF